MCGIAGIVSLDGFDPQTLVSITQMISYRGPNAFGFAYSSLDEGADVEIHHNDERPPSFARPALGLGNRRLAILDLTSTGNQPMQIDDGRFCVTYNGEIYNYKENRITLEKLGHQFVSASDTEVLLRSYKEWGEDCLQRFNGMWSFALFDRAARKLFCARDRFGVKPFYFTISDRQFVFGSEIKQVLAASARKRTANPRVVADFLEWGLQDHLPETSFEGVSQLLGGHSLVLDLNGPLRPRISRYWELSSQPELAISRSSAVDEFRTRFSDAVRLRLRSDVPVGVSLSGGLDSSAILCEAKRLAPDNDFQAFSACFTDARFDERTYISVILSATDSRQRWVFPDSESFWKNLDAIVYHQDEPIGGPSVFAQWSVMEEAKKNHISVLLGGQGGDELLCGYRKYYFFHLWHLLRNFNPSLFRESIAFAASGTASFAAQGAVARYLPALWRRKDSALTRLATPVLQNSATDVRRWMGAADSVAERQIIDLQITSLPKLLRHEDRNSMAHSVESRLPFLDYRLVEMAVRCPPVFKLHNGWSKWLMRESLAGVLPDPVRWRKTKLGFNTPESEWMRDGLRNGHQSLCKSSEIRLERLLHPQRLAAECKRFLEDRRDALPSSTLFRALSLELWARVHQVN
jgi:asparagine synthase (glutamine-hydrolysing)